MIGNIYLFAIFALAIGIEAKKISMAQLYPYVFELELKFNEERLNDYIIDSFFATNRQENNKLLHCDITLSDILKAVPYKKMTTSDFSAAVDELNFTFTDDDITNLILNLDYAELNAMGFTMERLHKSILKTYFKDRPADFLKCLNILGIAEEFSVAYAFGTDEDMFKALQNANFSHYNLLEIRNVINTPTNLKGILNILGVKKFDQYALENFINNKVTPLLIESGLTEENLKRFLELLNVSVGNYKSSKTFKNCYNSITKGNSLAVAISENEIITNDDSIVLKYLNLEQYVTLSAKSIENEDLIYAVMADNIDGNRTDNIISIEIDTILPNFIQETTTYSDITNKYCHYISIIDDELEIQDITANIVNEQLVISKVYNSNFKKGSPLICGQKLYGLASIDKPNQIVFDTFEESLSEEVSLPPHYKPEIINIIKEFFENIKNNIDPCKYSNCEDNDEQQENSASSENDIGNTNESLENNVEGVVEPVEENINESLETLQGTDQIESETVHIDENTDENNNLEQNEEENKTDQSEGIDETETAATDEIQNNQSSETNDQVELDEQSEGNEENVEEQNNDQGVPNSSQEIPDNQINGESSTQETDNNQSNVNDLSQDTQDEGENQEEVIVEHNIGGSSEIEILLEERTV